MRTEGDSPHGGVTENASGHEEEEEDKQSPKTTCSENENWMER